MKADSDALLCDLAETYGIFHFDQIPLSLLSVLAVGLHADARIHKVMSGQKIDTSLLLLAGIFDHTALLLWAQTKDGQKGRNRPKSLLQSFTKEKSKDITGYRTAEEFEKTRKKILKEIERRKEVENGD